MLQEVITCKNTKIGISFVLLHAQMTENEHKNIRFLQLRKKISFFICTFAPDFAKSE